MRRADVSRRSRRHRATCAARETAPAAAGKCAPARPAPRGPLRPVRGCARRAGACSSPPGSSPGPRRARQPGAAFCGADRSLRAGWDPRGQSACRRDLSCLRFRVAQALVEPPVVAAEVFAFVAAVAPVLLAVVRGLRLRDDPRARLARAPAVRLDVVHVDHEVLRVEAVDLAGAAAVRGLLALLRFADHDQTFAEAELGMLDAAAVALHLEADFEAERAAEPVDGLARFLVV